MPGRHQRLAAADIASSAIVIVDAASGESLTAPLHGPRQVADLAFSPDGNRLAAVGYDSTVKLWETDNYREVLTLKGLGTIASPQGWSPSVKFSHDGATLASTNIDGSINLWMSARPTSSGIVETETDAR